MLLILPKPAAKEVKAYTPLAINLQSYDEISIFEDSEKGLFILQLTKMCNPHVVNQSTSYSTLGIFRSAAGCLNLFQNIVDAFDAGDRVFDLPMPELPVHQSDSDTDSQNPPNRPSGYN